MPSPFPGMDPYLEHPAIFPGLHDRLIAYISETLQPTLPDPYYAEISDRLWVEVSERSIEPDVNVLRRDDDEGDDGESAGGVATARLTRTEPVVITVPHDEFREPFLNIMARIEDVERIVTTIEILSLTNKTPGKHGRDLYLQKQREVLDGEIHLVEIDLLRGGVHSTAVPLERALKKTGRFDYHVCVHCYDRFEDYFVYPFTLRDPLPEIAVPLRPGDGSVPLDLQRVFARCYETGPYHRRIRYGESPVEPALGGKDAEWASGIASVAK